MNTWCSDHHVQVHLVGHAVEGCICILCHIAFFSKEGVNCRLLQVDIPYDTVKVTYSTCVARSPYGIRNDMSSGNNASSEFDQRQKKGRCLLKKSSFILVSWHSRVQHSNIFLCPNLLWSSLIWILDDLGLTSSTLCSLQPVLASTHLSWTGNAYSVEISKLHSKWEVLIGCDICSSHDYHDAFFIWPKNKKSSLKIPWKTKNGASLTILHFTTVPGDPSDGAAHWWPMRFGWQDRWCFAVAVRPCRFLWDHHRDGIAIAGLWWLQQL